MSEWLELFWGEILSREPGRIRAAFAELTDEEERQAVLAHLRRMVNEAGWAEPQRESAQRALVALKAK